MGHTPWCGGNPRRQGTRKISCKINKGFSRGQKEQGLRVPRRMAHNVQHEHGGNSRTELATAIVLTRGHHGGREGQNLIHGWRNGRGFLRVVPGSGNPGPVIPSDEGQAGQYGHCCELGGAGAQAWSTVGHGWGALQCGKREGQHSVKKSGNGAEGQGPLCLRGPLHLPGPASVPPALPKLGVWFLELALKPSVLKWK